MAKYALGIDFGTESARAVLVDLPTAPRLAQAVYAYRRWRDRRAPAGHRLSRLEPDWALQNPADYVTRRQGDRAPGAGARAASHPTDVIGIGIDFTACTMLPTKADGTPLCTLPE